MKPRREHIATFIVGIVLVAGLGYLAWTQRPGADDGGGATGASTDLASLELGMLESHGPRPGEPAPDFVLEDAEGNRVRLADLRGTPVFMNFWATWCVFCLEEMPDMERIQQQFGDDLIVLGINNGEPASEGQPYARERLGVTYTLVYDPDQKVVEGYNVRAMPTSYFIDAEGIIQDFQFGFMTFEQMLDKVEAAMIE